MQSATRARSQATNMSDTDKVFTGSSPKFSDTHLVPLIFEPYAAGLTYRLRLRHLSRVLEVAAGTGVVTAGDY
jgi:hypothetical protein